jgi:hypothetical protein
MPAPLTALAAWVKAVDAAGCSGPGRRSLAPAPAAPHARTLSGACSAPGVRAAAGAWLWSSSAGAPATCPRASGGSSSAARSLSSAARRARGGEGVRPSRVRRECLRCMASCEKSGKPSQARACEASQAPAASASENRGELTSLSPFACASSSCVSHAHLPRRERREFIDKGETTGGLGGRRRAEAKARQAPQSPRPHAAEDSAERARRWQWRLGNHEPRARKTTGEGEAREAGEAGGHVPYQRRFSPRASRSIPRSA